MADDELPLTAPENAVAVQAEQAVVIPADGVLGAIMQLAANPAIDVDRIDKLIAMHERMEDRQAAREFQAAFVRMQAQLPIVKRDGSLLYPVDKNKPDGEKKLISKFAKWETVYAGIMPVLTVHGFGLSFRIVPRQSDGGGLGVCAVLRHAAGHVETSEPFPVPLDTSGGKNNTQAYGSSLSYGKRYAAFAALNIATEGEDDDGKTAGSGRKVTEEQSDELMAAAEKAGLLKHEDIGRFLSAHTNYQAENMAAVEAQDFARLANLLTMMAKRKTEADKKGKPE